VEAAESFDLNNDHFFGEEVKAEIEILRFFFRVKIEKFL